MSMNPQQLQSQIDALHKEKEDLQVKQMELFGQLALVQVPGSTDSAAVKKIKDAIKVNQAHIDDIDAQLVYAYTMLQGGNGNTENSTTQENTARDADPNGYEPMPSIETDLLHGHVYGLPPVYSTSDRTYKAILKNSFFVIKFAPIIYTTTTAEDYYTPNKIKGVSYNTLIDKMYEILKAPIYTDYLSVNSAYSSTVLKFFNFAVLNGRFTETLTNDYGESFWQTNMMSKLNEKGATQEQYRRASNIGGSQSTWGEHVQNLKNWMQKEKRGLLQTVSNAASVSQLGMKVDFPKIWKGSSWAISDPFTIKLVSPSSRPNDILEWVIKPAYILKMLASPYSPGAGDIFNNSSYLHVKIPYIGELPLAGISNLTITWGGETGAFSMDQLPLVADITLQIECMNSAVQITEKDVPGDMPNMKRQFNFMKGGIEDNAKSSVIYNNLTKIDTGKKPKGDTSLINSNRRDVEPSANQNTTPPVETGPSTLGPGTDINSDLTHGYLRAKI